MGAVDSFGITLNQFHMIFIHGKVTDLNLRIDDSLKNLINCGNFI